MDEHTGIRHIYLHQFLNSIQIIPVDLAFHFNKNGLLVYSTGTFISNPDARLLNKRARFKADQAIQQLFKIKSIELEPTDL